MSTRVTLPLLLPLLSAAGSLIKIAKALEVIAGVWRHKS